MKSTWFYCILAITLAADAAAVELSNCRPNHRGEMQCTATNGHTWRAREDHRGRTVWTNRTTGEQIRQEPRQDTRPNHSQFRNTRTQGIVATTTPYRNGFRFDYTPGSQYCVPDWRNHWNCH